MIKIGLVGLGMISHAIHVPQILKDPRFKITALCDLNVELLLEVGEELGIPLDKRYTDYHQMIDNAGIDAVDIATSNDAHFEIAMYAVTSGKSYSLEKPIALNYAQAEALRRSTEENNIKNMMCFSYRYKSAARYCRELVKNKKSIGDITHVNAQYYQAWALPDANVELVWRFIKSKTGSGALGDLGSHMLDLVPFMTGLEYKSVVGQLGTFIKERKMLDSDKIGEVDVDDYSNFLIDANGSASASFEISRLAFGRGNYQRIEIYGTKGAYVYQLDVLNDVDQLFEILPDSSGQPTETIMEIPEKFTKVQMSDFADVIEGKDDGLHANVLDGAKNQYYMDVIIKSSEEGNRCEF